MSHLPERKEKKCLNCGIDVIGRFCHNCGQQNVEPKESLWHLITHFVSDVTHFDGQFFSSLKYLLIKPGFLSREYMVGRRASYLNPIRMYLFTSAIFFLVFFSLFKIDEKSFEVKSTKIGQPDSTATEVARELKNEKIITGEAMPSKKALGSKSAVNREIQFSASDYKSKEEYDSLLKTGVKKDNWLQRQVAYKSIEINEKYKNNVTGFFKNLLEKFIHTLPQMLFVLLPLFALILKLVYIRRKEYYYTDHVIFSLHTYVFVFIAMMIIFGINELEGLSNWTWLNYVSGALVISIFFYFYKSLRSFYKQRRAKTIIKYFIILLLLLIITVLLFAFFFFLSLFQL